MFPEISREISAIFRVTSAREKEEAECSNIAGRIRPQGLVEVAHESKRFARRKIDRLQRPSTRNEYMSILSPGSVEYQSRDSLLLFRHLFYSRIAAISHSIAELGSHARPAISGIVHFASNFLDHAKKGKGRKADSRFPPFGAVAERNCDFQRKRKRKRIVLALPFVNAETENFLIAHCAAYLIERSKGAVHQSWAVRIRRRRI